MTCKFHIDESNWLFLEFILEVLDEWNDRLLCTWPVNICFSRRCCHLMTLNSEMCTIKASMCIQNTYHKLSHNLAHLNYPHHYLYFLFLSNSLIVSFAPPSLSDWLSNRWCCKMGHSHMMSAMGLRGRGRGCMNFKVIIRGEARA